MYKKVKFYSDTNYQLFTDHIDLRYPGNLMEHNIIERTVVFKGGNPSVGIEDLARELSGEWTDVKPSKD